MLPKKKDLNQKRQLKSNIVSELDKDKRLHPSASHNDPKGADKKLEKKVKPNIDLHPAMEDQKDEVKIEEIAVEKRFEEDDLTQKNYSKQKMEDKFPEDCIILERIRSKPAKSVTVKRGSSESRDVKGLINREYWQTLEAQELTRYITDQGTNIQFNLLQNSVPFEFNFNNIGQTSDLYQFQSSVPVSFGAHNSEFTLESHLTTFENLLEETLKANQMPLLYKQEETYSLSKDESGKALDMIKKEEANSSSSPESVHIASLISLYKEQSSISRSKSRTSDVKKEEDLS